MEDITQAQKMWTLRVKIDAWSKGKVDEATRQRNRELLLDAYLRLPLRRVWLYVKFARLKMLEDAKEKYASKKQSGTRVLEPEDVVFQLKGMSYLHQNRPRALTEH